MSDTESNDGLLELQELIDEYAKKPETATETLQKQKDVKKNKKSIKKQNAGNTEEVMDKLLFGDKETFLETLAEAVEDVNTRKKNDDVDENNQKSKINNKRKPKWHDNDDDIHLSKIKTRINDDHKNMEKYKDFLVKRFNRIVKEPKWASLDNKETEGNDIDDSDDELLKSVGFINKRYSRVVLKEKYLEFKRLRDLNRATYAEGMIGSIQFHPTSTAALVTGENGLATIYSIDGYKNEKLHSILFPKFPIVCAKITPCGTKAVFGSKRSWYYSYDLLAAKETRYQLPSNKMHSMKKFQISPCGRYIISSDADGVMHLLDAHSHELIHTFRQEYYVTNMRFTSDSKRVIFATKSCNVYIYSIREQRIEHTFVDNGCILGNALDLSPNQRILATGSSEGIVNVYDYEKILRESNPIPDKSFFHLTTTITDLKFNHSSELLAMCSKSLPSAVKMAHFPSGHIYANFPEFKSGLGNVHKIEFSPNSGYLAIGNQVKNVSLFKLKHFRLY